MSKFDKIFEAREIEEVMPKKNVGKPSSRAVKPKIVSKTEKPVQLNQVNVESRQRGRPPAKRSDPDYVGFTTYIRKDTHLKVKISLLQEGKGRELSELVETLLSGWADNNQK